ncbi:SDR family NAD(P)-dependent oxidoreductase [Pseudofrankia inefficax]|uniref:Short-chain dehydrogenase/reductase SDR n=1 Tax=Pseudofrankia inefficax (strain DSM 45817 / CECT 9037 / DDB 130130 / EuI1c) TaxID=298654 RepID=E3J7T8_PSEI1|nr:SDR family NAD(P)-dependent oxidoreductase [Pseudofrankia inefficax]ADP80842.1 short-chain dehydrogenase/reductase SDR [Pseudofrankia inefficax]
MDLRGKVAIVTGASRGVGAALAVALAREGCSVVCAARSTAGAPQRTPGTLDDTVDRANEAGRGAGAVAVAVPTNLAVQDEVVAMVATTVERFGGVDILVNNAAITFAGDLNQPLNRHDLTMEINYRAPYLAIREARVSMAARGGGSIINVSSFAALQPLPNMLAYGTSKIALEHLTMDAARELYPQGIAVNCFRIDVPVASEGFVANTPGADRTGWKGSDVPVEGMLWMLRQPVAYTGRRESMYHLGLREGLMGMDGYQLPSGTVPRTELFDGLWESSAPPVVREPAQAHG